MKVEQICNRLGELWDFVDVYAKCGEKNFTIKDMIETIHPKHGGERVFSFILEEI